MTTFACDNVNLPWKSLKVSYAALDANSNRDFEAVQNVVLAAYEVIAMAYTQM